MSKSAYTVFIFGIYLFALSLVLLVAPNFLLRMFSLPETNEVWIRVVGMIVSLLGYLYVQSARLGLHSFFLLTVYERSVVIVFFTVFVALGWTEKPLILFGVVDLLGALWTWMALRSERS